MIKVDQTKANHNARNIYTRAAYIFNVALEISDQLKETNQYRQELKQGLNIACKEMEKITEKHFKGMEEMGFVELNGTKIHGLEMYKTAGDAYQLVFDFLTQKESADVVVLAEMIKSYDKEKAKTVTVDIESMQI